MVAAPRTWVIESASSRMRSLKGGHGYPAAGCPIAADANDLTLLRTTSMPRSSLAFSSIVRTFISSGLAPADNVRPGLVVKLVTKSAEACDAKAAKATVFLGQHDYAYRSIITRTVA